MKQLENTVLCAILLFTMGTATAVNAQMSRKDYEKLCAKPEAVKKAEGEMTAYRLRNDWSKPLPKAPKGYHWASYTVDSGPMLTQCRALERDGEYYGFFGEPKKSRKSVEAQGSHPYYPTYGEQRINPYIRGFSPSERSAYSGPNKSELGSGLGWTGNTKAALDSEPTDSISK